MKKNTYSIKGPKGVTLIELTVVIAVILILISTLIMGAKWYLDGAAKTGCAANRDNILTAATNHISMAATVPTTLTVEELTTADASGSAPLKATPVCKKGGTYTITVTDGIASVACSKAAAPDLHVATTDEE